MAVTPNPPTSPCIERSKLILAGGLSTSAAILAVWLLIWILFFRSGVRVLAFASGPTDATAPASLLFQDLDARATGGVAKSLSLRSDVRDLIASVSEHLDRERRLGCPAVVYLASPAVNSFGADGKGTGEAVLPPPGIFGGVLLAPDIPGGTSLKKLIEVFKAARGKRLLILDIGRSAADGDAAAWGDDPIAGLKKLVPDRPGADRPAVERETWRRAWEGFAILCSCGPGQWAWSSDADGQSVFGLFVAEELRYEKADVQGLLRWVPHHVDRWVRANRRAVQTPMVLGDTSVSFSLPRVPSPRDEEDPRLSGHAEALRARLRDVYQVEAAYAGAGVFLLDPLAWREYRQCWLRAERLLRAGRLKEADDLLTQAGRHAAAFDPRPKGGEDWPSLALALKVTTDGSRRQALKKKAEDLATLIGGLRTGRLAAPAPAEADARAAILAGDNPVEGLAEGQLIGWAKDYARALAVPGRGLDAVAWLDGPRFAEALGLRGLAEDAASTFVLRHPWVEDPLREADARRREAGDLLFAPGNHSVAVDEAHRKAEVGYRSAIAVADALRLAGQVAADLPALGAWYVRRRAADVERITSIAQAAHALDRLIVDGFHGPSEVPLDELKKRVSALKPAFDALVDEFTREAGAAKTSRDWRRIDDALAVPRLDPKLRDELVSASINPESFPPIRIKPVAPKGQSGSAVKNLAIEWLINRNLSTHTLARGALDPSAGGTPPAESDPGPAPEQAPDSGFETQRRLLAQFDRALVLAVGSEGTPGQSPPGIAGPATDLDRQARSARSRRLREASGAGTDAESRRFTFERARLALPASSSIRDGDDSAPALPARWDKMLLRLANRLLADGDRDLAQAFIKEVKATDTEVETTRRGIEALARSIRVEFRPSGPFVLADRSSAKADIAVDAPGLPTGLASLRLGNPGGLVVPAPDGPFPLGGGASGPRSVQVRRPEAKGRESGKARLVPIVFYRGRVGVADVAVDLPRIDAEFVVAFSSRNILAHRDEMKKFLGKARLEKIRDQVVERPTSCSIYTGADTELDAALTYKPGAGRTARRVRVTVSLGGVALPVAVGPVKVKPTQKVATALFQPGDKVTIAIGAIVAGSAEATATLRLEIRAEDDTPLHEQELTIRFVEPGPFYRTTARTIPGPTGHRVLVKVERLASDPIGMVTSAWVRVDGRRARPVSNPRADEWVAQADGRVNEVALLLHGESAEFVLDVDPAAEHTWQAFLSSNGLDERWPLSAEGKLATPAPPPAPAAGQPQGAPALVPGLPGPTGGGPRGR